MKIQGLTEPSFDEKSCPLTIDDANNIYHFSTNDIPYRSEVSSSSAFVYGIESFKQSIKEIPFGVQANVGGLLQKTGKTMQEYFPDGVDIFNGAVNVKIGDKLVEGGKLLSRTANRNLDVMRERYKKESPRLESAQQKVAFDFGSQGANWTSMLLAGPYSPFLMAGLTMTGETQERLEKWKETHGTVEGYEERQGEDSVWNVANSFVQGTIEKYLGSWAQVKAVKKGWGYVKAIGKNAIQEGFVEEPLQDVTDFYFDKLSGLSEDETLRDRMFGSLRGYVVASIFGGAGGYSAALYHRSTGIETYKDVMKGTVPEQDLEKAATKAYEQDAKTMRDIITVELESSSSLQAKRGEVYESLYNAALEQVKVAKEQGGFPELQTEEDIANYVKSVADRFADETLAEANRRNTVIEEVLDPSLIRYENGQLVMPMTKGTGVAKNVAVKNVGYADFRNFIDEESNPVTEEIFNKIKDAISTYGNNISYEELMNKVGKELDADMNAVSMSNEDFMEVFDYIAEPNRQALLQESLDIANQNAELDKVNPAYEGETIDINGVERTVYNSNGDRIAQSEPALRNFYKWFGDSKVVDEQGRPLVVYHGTNAEFDTFDKSKQKRSLYGKGFYFTDTIEWAKQFISPISWKNIKDNDKRVMPLYLSIKKPYVTDKMNNDAQELQEQGYDGIIVKNYDTKYLVDNPDADIETAPVRDTTYIAFEPNQIKSTSNRGTYSESENIYLQSAFAGSPVDYDKPSLEAIGSGEGNQAHGYGLYYALSRDVAEGYRERSFARKSFTEVQSLDQEFDKVLVRGQPLLDVYDIDIDRSLLETLLYKPYGVVEAELEKRINQWTEFLNKDDYPYKKYAKDKIDAYTRLKDDLFNNGMSLIKQDVGQVHEVDIPENPYLLDEDLTFNEQPEFVKEKLKEVLLDDAFSKFFDDWGSAEEFAKVELDDYNQGMTGGNIYDRISDMLGSDREASTILEKHGIKGITYVGDIDGRCFVIFNPDDVKVIQKFYQDVAGNPQGAKGSIQFKGDRALITLTEEANSSTLAHELAHYWLQNTFLYSKSGLATPEYKQFFNSIAKYLDITDDQETIKEWQQEKWARAAEMYAMGKAPEGMEGPLTQYQQWIRKAYGEVSEPMYIDENGEAKVPEFDFETMKMFANLAGETLTEPEFKQKQEAVRGLAKSTNQMAQAKGMKTELPTYEKRSATDMGKKADEFIQKNKQLAIDIVKGLKPEQEGLFRQDLFAALRELALNEGDSDLLNELSKSMTVEEATELGQRIQALARGRIDPVKQMVELRDERMKKNKVDKKKLKEETEKAKKEIKKEMAEASTPKEWADFIKSLEC